MVLTPTGVRLAGRRFPCSIGKGGVTVSKREGDGATPAGVHRIVGLLYRPDRMARPTPWACPVGPVDLWSDDPRDPEYNLHVRKPHRYGHEALRRADPLYDLILLTDWNWPRAVPGAGSAIFLHQWRRPGYPTEGCIAFRRDHLRWIVERAIPGTRLVVSPHVFRRSRPERHDIPAPPPCHASTSELAPAISEANMLPK